MRLSRFNATKRALDLALIAVTAPVTLPIGAATAIAVRVGLGSPILYRQSRIGLGEREFEVLKFRTMSDSRSDDGMLLPDAERLTRLGRFLRAASLDEIPQLINVLKGEMSLIGPRPLFSRYLPYYTKHERLRHLVRPGITGLAQVSGRNYVGWNERLRLDAEYVEEASLSLDLRIVASTITQVLARENVSVVASETGEPLDVERSYPADGGLTLRRLQAKDLPQRVAWIRHPATQQHMQWPQDVSEKSTREWFDRSRRDPERVDLVVESAGETIAMAGLRLSEPDSAEFYIFVNPARQGLGYGKRATALVLRYGWEHFGLSRVTLTVAQENVAAVRIYESLGFGVSRRTTDRLYMEVAKA